MFSLAPNSDSEVVAASALTSLLSAPSSPTHSYSRLQQEGSGELKLPQRFTKNGRKRAIPFPLKLMQVLSDKQYSHIITWMPSGRSFVIIRPSAFVNDILPKHFKSAQYASFTRKLARWGFNRCEEGTGEFYHPQFRKGRVDLAEKMACGNNSIKTTQAAAAIKEANEMAASLRGSKKTVPPTATDSVASDTDDHSVEDLELASKLKDNLQKQRAIAMELEMMRFEQSIRAAAASRKALAGIQQRNKIALSSRAPSEALAIITGLPPELSWGGLHGGSLAYPVYPSHLVSPASMQALVQSHANIRGAKTA